MQENKAVKASVEISVANLPFEFPYLKTQDKVNFLRQTSGLPLVSWKNVEDGDYYEYIMCLPSAAAT